MHPRFQELTALRAQLQRLPAFTPPAEAWQRIEQALHPVPAGAAAGAPVSPANGRHWRFAAVAAAVLPVCALALFWLQRERATVGDAGSASPAGDSAVAALVGRSQQLEAMLQQLPPRPAVERAATSAAIDALQSRIQRLDVQLSSGDAGGGNDTQTQQLWGERVQLLNSLVGMRYAEAVRVDVQAATHEGAI